MCVYGCLCVYLSLFSLSIYLSVSLSLARSLARSLAHALSMCVYLCFSRWSDRSLARMLFNAYVVVPCYVACLLFSVLILRADLEGQFGKLL